jgi:hypothetical protein
MPASLALLFRQSARCLPRRECGKSVQFHMFWSLLFTTFKSTPAFAGSVRASEVTSVTAANYLSTFRALLAETAKRVGDGTREDALEQQHDREEGQVADDAHGGEADRKRAAAQVLGNLVAVAAAHANRIEVQHGALRKVRPDGLAVAVRTVQKPGTLRLQSTMAVSTSLDCG